MQNIRTNIRRANKILLGRLIIISTALAYLMSVKVRMSHCHIWVYGI